MSLPNPILKGIGITLVLAAVYFAAGKLGLKLAFVHASATAVWPPTGIALAAVLILGYRIWPAIFLGAFLVNITTEGSVATTLGIAAGNTLEGLTGAYLVNRAAHGRHVFDRTQDMLKFAVLAGMVSTTVSATCGVTSLSLGGFAHWSDYSSIWLTWWLGDAGGALVVTPPLLLWYLNPHVGWERSQAFEAALLLLVLVVAGLIVFGGWLPTDVKNYPLDWLCVPTLVWAAFRFGPRETATASFLLAGIAIWGTLRGYGPFVEKTQNESLLLLQAFMVTTTIMALALATVVMERRQAVEEIQRLNSQLEERVIARTAELVAANKELEAFSYSVSHDLRAPLRSIDGFSQALVEDYADRLDAPGQDYLRRVRAACRHMADLIDDLLDLSRVTRSVIQREPVDLSALALAIVEDLRSRDPARVVEVVITPGLVVHGDAKLLRVALENLLSNAWKYTGKRAAARIEFGTTNEGGQPTYFVRDNGAGFDMAYADKLFGVFQRLHSVKEFEGSGIGLATIQRIIQRHGGRVWAEGTVDQGATFYFTLQAKEKCEGEVQPFP